MHPLRRTLPLALAVGLIAAAPAASEAAPGARAPVAHAAGGDAAPPMLPGLVNTRLIRTQKALDRAVDYADDGDTAKAVSALYASRLQVKLAWRAAKYQIQHAPPPVVGEDRSARQVRVQIRLLKRQIASQARGRARTSGGAVGGSAIADQYTTAGAVLAMQHTVAQTAIGMIDTAHGTLRDSLSRTLFTALDQRDAAVTYIHSIDVPPPPGDDRRASTSSVPVARASGGAVAATWASVMPLVADQVDDEINQIDGVIELSTTLGGGIRRVLQDGEFQAVKTQRAINQYWPPVPAED